jgi:hypothetical protein
MGHADANGDRTQKLHLSDTVLGAQSVESGSDAGEAWCDGRVRARWRP